MQLSEKCTVVINSCDNYSDLWDPFFILFKKYWKDCPLGIVLNTEKKSYHDADIDIKVINYERQDNTYGNRIRNCLRKIDTPYVLLMLDDFFIREPVNMELVEKTISYLDENPDVICFNFDVAGDQYDEDDGRFLEYQKRSKYGSYRYNMQAGIWRTKALYDAWKPKESPWQWELYGNVRSWNENKKIYVLKEYMKTPIEYGYYPDARGVYRGKWVIEDVKDLFDKNNIEVDYSKRGIYKKEDESEPKRFVISPKIYSYGIVHYVKYIFWYTGRIMHRMINKGDKIGSYSESLNKRYYSKRR